MSSSFITKFMFWTFMAVATWGQTWKSGATTVTLSGDTLTVSGKGAMEDYDPIEGWPRAPWWDESRSSVTSVIVEDSVISIGDGAFSGFTSLTSVVIGNNVKSIGEFAFLYCISLTSITIPYGVMSIRAGTFNDCKALSSVTIPNSVTSIEDRAFGSTALTSIIISKGVRMIASTAFVSCTSLTSINVVTDNENYSSVDGVLFNKNKTILIAYPAGKQGAYIVPHSVTEIGDYAFSRSNGLTSVTIPSSVKIIGKHAFRLPSRLTSIISLNPIPFDIEIETLTGGFHPSASLCLYVPESSIDAYRSANGWNELRCIKGLESAPRGE